MLFQDFQLIKELNLGLKKKLEHDFLSYLRCPQQFKMLKVFITL
jgi:hypothetical protein